VSRGGGLISICEISPDLSKNFTGINLRTSVKKGIRAIWAVPCLNWGEAPAPEKSLSSLGSEKTVEEIGPAENSDKGSYQWL